MKPIRINGRDGYSPLRTLLLGDVFDPEDAPPYFPPEHMDAWREILARAKQDLANMALTFQQLGVRVVRPRIPWTWTGAKGKHNLANDSRWISRAGKQPIRLVPPLNMRDHLMVYGDTLFAMQGSRPGRQFEHHCLSDVFSAAVMGGSRVAAMPHVGGYDQDWQPDQMMMDDQGLPPIIVREKHLAKAALGGEISPDRIKKMNDDEYPSNRGRALMKYRFALSNKILFHSAGMLTNGDKVYSSAMAGTAPGHAWIRGWLERMGAEIVDLPFLMHIDGIMSILDKDTVMTNRAQAEELELDKHFKRIINVNMDGVNREQFSSAGLYMEMPPDFHLDMAGYPQEFLDNCNIVIVNAETAVSGWYDKDTYNKVKNATGMEIIYAPWRDRRFWEGGLHCITCDLEREDPR
jgi:hypothetical protein